jgi:MFS-type transporter involved in bile tolerance (Atg22 family)
MRYVALPLLAYSISRNPLTIALVPVLESLPWMFFAPVVAAWIDHWEKRRILVWANLVRGSLVLVFALLLLNGPVPMVAVYALALVLPFPQMASDSAAQTALQQLVEDDSRETANSRLLTAGTLVEDFIAAPAAGALFALVSGVPFVLDSVTFFAAAALMLIPLGWPRITVGSAAAGEPRTPLRQGVREGWQALRGLRPVMQLAVITFVLDLSLTAGTAISAIFAKEDVGLSDFQYGLIFSFLSAGGVLGGVLSPRLVARFGMMPTLIGAMFLLGFARLAFGFSSGVFLACASFLAAGLGAFIWHVAWSSYLQRIVPAALLGRVYSITESINHAALVGGAFLGVVVASVASVRAAMLLGGFVVVGCAVVSLVVLGRRSELPAQDSEAEEKTGLSVTPDFP